MLIHVIALLQHIIFLGLTKYRNDEMFTKFFELANKKAQDKGVPPALPRQ